MRYLGRTHAVSVAAMKEVIDLKEVRVEYISTKKMRADILTKGFSSGATWDAARYMIMTGRRNEIVPCMSDDVQNGGCHLEEEYQ